MIFTRLAILASLAATVLAKGTYMPPLSDAVMEDLAKRDIDSYETFALRDAGDEALDKRGPPNGLTGIKTRCTKSKCISYTFDDGPYNDMRTLTDAAVNAGIKATFFVNANNFDCIYNPKRVSDLKYAYSKGMQICSHTVSHPHLNTLSHAQIDAQIEGVETALYKILGVVPSCFRPPYGEANDDVVNYINNRWGYVIANWNFDTKDADGASVSFSKRVIDGIKAPKHAILLMHETIHTTATSIFPYAISKGRQNGYTAASTYTIPGGLGFNGYKVIGKPSKRDSTWTCANLPQPGGN